MRVLVHVALAPKTPKIYARTITTLFNMEWQEPLDIVFARNDNPLDGKLADVRDKHEAARLHALAGDYDAVLFVENDMVIPADALVKLAAVDADVVYGLYCARYGVHPWLCAIDMTMDWATWLSDRPELAKESWGKVISSKGFGFGCTLVRRTALEAVQFRLDAVRYKGLADDWFFSWDLQQAGLSQAHHLGVVCGHIAAPGGSARILWPDAHADYLHAVEPLDARQVQRANRLVVNTSGFTMTEVFAGEEGDGVLHEG